jgi:hypothetical protein
LSARVADVTLGADRPKERKAMCRWMGWLGQPLLVDELLFEGPGRRTPER